MYFFQAKDFIVCITNLYESANIGRGVIFQFILPFCFWEKKIDKYFESQFRRGFDNDEDDYQDEMFWKWKNNCKYPFSS